MCTVLRLKNENGYLMVKNNDTFIMEGILFTNKRGISKSALIMPPQKPLRWVSRFGSVSFSQCGKELPVGGINEAGLVVEQTTLPETVYSNCVEKPAVGELQVIQFILDTCSNVNEGIVAFEQVEISQPVWTIHYVLFDKSGEMAVVEYIQGEKKVYHGQELPVKVLANSRYDKCMEMQNGEMVKLELESEYERNSLERFIRAARCSEEYLDCTVDGAFAALEEVKRPDTVWSIVYDTCTLSLYFATKDNRDIKYLSLKDFDFSKESASHAYTLTNSAGGDIKACFEKYSAEINSALVKSFFKNEVITSVMKISFPDELLHYLIQYPEALERESEASVT